MKKTKPKLTSRPFAIRRDQETGKWRIARLDAEEMVMPDGSPNPGEFYGEFDTEQEAERELQWIIKDINSRSDRHGSPGDCNDGEAVGEGLDSDPA